MKKKLVFVFVLSVFLFCVCVVLFTHQVEAKNCPINAALREGHTFFTLEDPSYF